MQEEKKKKQIKRREVGGNLKGKGGGEEWNAEEWRDE